MGRVTFANESIQSCSCGPPCWGRVTHICVSKIIFIGSGNGFWWHYLNQWRNIVDCTLGNKLQWNFNRDQYVFIQEKAFEAVVGKLVSISFQPQWRKMCFLNSFHHKNLGTIFYLDVRNEIWLPNYIVTVKDLLWLPHSHPDSRKKYSWNF